MVSRAPAHTGPRDQPSRARGWRRASSFRERLWQLALAGLGARVGAGVDPRIAVAAAIGLAFVVLVLGDLTIGLCLFAVVAFLDVLPHLGGSALSFTKLVGFLLAISWLAKVSSDADSRNDFLAAHPTFTYVLALFIGWAALSLTWAEGRPGSAARRSCATRST